MRKRIYTTKKECFNCVKCIIFRNAKNEPEEENITEASDSEQNDDGESESGEQDEDEDNQKYRT